MLLELAGGVGYHVDWGSGWEEKGKGGSWSWWK